MKPMYSIEELKSKESDDIKFRRYMHKYSNDRKNFDKLKTHEKHYFFSWVPHVRDANNRPCLDIYEIDQAREYLFNKLILTYGKNLDFCPPIQGPFGKISTGEIQRDKEKFLSLYEEWCQTILKGKGKYITHIKNELGRKCASCNDAVKLNIKFYFIYYKVKYFFEAQTKDYVSTNIDNFEIIANIYTYVHILSRHYIPDLENPETLGTLSKPINCVDVEELPISLIDIVERYYKNKKLLSTEQYLLFEYEKQKYIIWIKYKKLSEINSEYGFEVRSMYECKEARDTDKFLHTRKVVDGNIIFYYN